MNNKKSNGSYYTPNHVADFIIHNLEMDTDITREIDVLEPSCGDGAFIRPLLESDYFKGLKGINLYLVEKDEVELNKTIRLLDSNINPNVSISAFRDDYLEFHKTNNKKFDFIIGNPPYIKRNYLTERQIELCKEIQRSIGMDTNDIKNIWISFVISAVDSLKDNGTLCFILPGEILQVKYASKLRVLLNEQFRKVEIYTFKERIFDTIEQDVVIIFAYKKPKEDGFFYYNIDVLEELAISLEPSQSITHISKYDKWTGYVLDEKELQKIYTQGEGLKKIRDYCTSGAGIVTAANKYFILPQKMVDKYKLNDVVLPIIQKSNYVPNCLKFTLDDYKRINYKNKPSKMVFLENHDVSIYNYSIKKYLEIGISKEIHKRFKCTKRSPWYKVQSVWESEGIFFKRSHKYPKIIYNEANTYVTDTGYRIKMKENYDIKSLVFCFYNSLTLSFCELTGRFYGGGVLELTPNEFKELPIPYFKISKKEFETLDKLLRKENNMKLVIDYVDGVILERKLGLDNKKILFLKSMHKRLLDCRLKEEL